MAWFGACGASKPHAPIGWSFRGLPYPEFDALTALFLQIMLYWSAPLTLSLCMSSEHLQATLSNSLDNFLSSDWLATWQSLCFWPNCIATAVTSPSLHSAYLLEFWGYGDSISNLWEDLHILEVTWDYLVSLCPDPTLLTYPPSFADPFLPLIGAFNAFPTSIDTY